MNQRFWSSLTAAVVTTVLGITSSIHAQEAKVLDQGSETSLLPAQMLVALETALSSASGDRVKEKLIARTAASSRAQGQSPAVVKMAQQSPADEGGITKIVPHELAGYQAATLYFRNIPLLTFIGSLASSAGGYDQNIPTWRSSSQPESQEYPTTTGDNYAQDDPVARSQQVAAKLNQLSRDNVDAHSIALTWNALCNCYTIKVNGEALVQIDRKTRLPNSTQNIAEDALKVANQLRRLIVNAPPVGAIAGKPKLRRTESVGIAPNSRVAPRSPQISLRPAVRSQISGLASWYGPGFDGRKSASGEIFNQNALTAAHRKLPFGTQVRVTNLNNGRSVVVRINDRGPFIGGRVIDLSTAAAKALGMMQTGVARVRLDVLNSQQATAFNKN